ncbi:MAG: twin-arginine translocation signal domain-containing protein [Gemmatimonadales bacterium]|nr:MAG: twin-arginine translocation signal domain-containing protein [Gemmatimonadales bacterium]
MSKPTGYSRRDFIKTGSAAAGLGLAAPAALAGAFPEAPAVIARRSRPAVVSSGNGHQYRHDGDLTCVETVFQRMTAGDDILDSVIAGVRINELDPGDTSVGYGGLPNGDGVVQLDASVMHGPMKRAGSVACLEGVRTPAAVARAVMHETDHHLLVGPDAQRFARNMGFTIEDDLNSDVSRARWLDWRRRTDPSRWPGEDDPQRIGFLSGMEMVEEGLIDPEHYWGTINCNAVNAAGEIAGCTTTSGLAWKIPGRVGDSPILGAGLYVDGEVGAAGSTGRGEANLYNLTSFLIVENLRRGMTPLDAGMDAIRRIQQNTIEPRLLNEQGEPNFGIRFYILNAAGEHAGVTLRGGGNYAICTENGPEMVPFESLL